MFVKGFFSGDGSSRKYNYNSKAKNCWHWKNQDFNLSEKLHRFCKEIWNEIDFETYDVRKISYLYSLSVSRKNIAFDFANFYTKEKEKRIPTEILNESLGIRKWFFIGIYAADGHRKVNLKKFSISKT